MTATPGTVPIALTIAGSDSSGGAGIQADLKTFTAFGVYGASVITALTAQNTQGVRGFETVSPAFVVGADGCGAGGPRGRRHQDRHAGHRRDRHGHQPAGWPPDAQLPLVVDPVMVATSGDALIAPDAVEAVRQRAAAARRPDHAQPARGRAPAGSQAGRHGCRGGRAGQGTARARLPGGADQGRARRGRYGGRLSLRRRDAAALRAAAGRYPPHAWHRLHAVGGHHGPAGAGRAPATRPWNGPRPSSGRGCRRAATCGSGMARVPSTSCTPSAAKPAGVTAGVSLLQPVQLRLPGWPDSG